MLGEILWGIIGGAFVGIIGRLLLPGRQDISMPMTVVAGVVAATVGGMVASWLGVGDTKGVDWIRHAIQIGLAVAAVWLATKWFTKRTGGQASTFRQSR